MDTGGVEGIGLSREQKELMEELVLHDEVEMRGGSLLAWTTSGALKTALMVFLCLSATMFLVFFFALLSSKGEPIPPAYEGLFPILTYGTGAMTALFGGLYIFTKLYHIVDLENHRIDYRAELFGRATHKRLCLFSELTAVLVFCQEYRYENFVYKVMLLGKDGKRYDMTKERPSRLDEYNQMGEDLAMLLDLPVHLAVLERPTFLLYRGKENLFEVRQGLKRSEHPTGGFW